MATHKTESAVRLVNAKNERRLAVHDCPHWDYSGDFEPVHDCCYRLLDAEQAVHNARKAWRKANGIATD